VNHPTEPGTLRRGRPRKAATDAAIIRAAVELMTELGVEGTTLTAVANRAGVARATVYLRWPTRSALIGAAARAGVGGRPLPLTGNLEHDIRFGTSFVQRVFDDPTFPALLPEIVRGVLAGELSFESVAPRRKALARIYAERAAVEGFDPTVDPHLAFDILLGTAIAYLLANGHPMSGADAARLEEVIVRGLRAQRGDPAASS
jgi:AcrR family transcriptional regulator